MNLICVAPRVPPVNPELAGATAGVQERALPDEPAVVPSLSMHV
jgi:hypothetical protein